MIITIDGPSASGKSTLARELAKQSGISYLNTGATYRAAAIKAMREGIDLADESEARKVAKRLDIEFIPPTGSNAERVLLDGEDITDEVLSPEVSLAASIFSRHRCVREKIVELQRKIAKRIFKAQTELPQDQQQLCGIVLEGRDTGTVVFPDADIKIFLTASAEERARRRLIDYNLPESELENLKAEIEARDRRDIERDVSPLIPAEDARLVNNSEMTIEQTVQRVLELINSKT
jgi:cytidylate kinase